MTDEELLQSFRNGDKAACEQLLSRYKTTVLTYARRFFLLGGETEDLVQEGMCGLYSAMTGYDSSQAGFSSYACACIRNRILDAVKAGNTKKNTALNSSLPLEEGGALSGKNPEEELINGEAEREFLSIMQQNLSSFEYKVTAMYIDGFSMNEISASLGKSYKSIDNAIARSKRKLHKIFIAEK